MEDIGVRTATGIIEPFTTNSIPICIRCGERLTEENKSLWSDVVGSIEDCPSSKTQGVCKDCLTTAEIVIDSNKGKY